MITVNLGDLPPYLEDYTMHRQIPFVEDFILGAEKSARSLSDRSFFEPPWGRGRPRLRVMNVPTEMLVVPGFRGPDRSFCPGRPPGYPRGRSPDIQPQNFLFGPSQRSPLRQTFGSFVSLLTGLLSRQRDLLHPVQLQMLQGGIPQGLFHIAPRR